MYTRREVYPVSMTPPATKLWQQMLLALGKWEMWPVVAYPPSCCCHVEQVPMMTALIWSWSLLLLISGDYLTYSNRFQKKVRRLKRRRLKSRFFRSNLERRRILVPVVPPVPVPIVEVSILIELLQ